MVVLTEIDARVAGVAASIGEPARARMLYSLLDGHARTATELSAVAEVSASTASVHLARLKAYGLVTMTAQGRHRYFVLASHQVARALEALAVVAHRSATFVPSTPVVLREARTCYDHMAGALAVALYDRFLAAGWLELVAGTHDYQLTEAGSCLLRRLKLDENTISPSRRRFAFACLDWSERRPHLAGALGAALLELSLRRRWLRQDTDSRRLQMTAGGRIAWRDLFGVDPL